MIDRTSDIPATVGPVARYLRHHLRPQFPASVRGHDPPLGNSGPDRFIVVCHNPKRALFDYDRLQQFGNEMNVRGYSSSANDVETRAFWKRFFDEELCPLIRQKAAAFTGDDLAAAEKLLTREEAQQALNADRRRRTCCPASRTWRAKRSTPSTPTSRTPTWPASLSPTVR
ncbi:MAG: hypothetical protein VCF24_26990 [Candidatus Latescibacterota bacterium]